MTDIFPFVSKADEELISLSGLHVFSLSDSALEEGKVCSGTQSFGSQPGLPAALLDLGLSLTDQKLSSAKCLQKYPTVSWLCHAPYLLIQLHTDS